jgi:hypothetical protein
MNGPLERYAREKRFHPKTLERLLALSERDRDALAPLIVELKPSENHLRDLLDWLEEIGLRDGVGFEAVFDRVGAERIRSDPRLGRAERLKRIKEGIRRLRFPRLSEIESVIEARIRSLRLGPAIEASVPPGLEGGALTFVVRTKTAEDLRRAATALGQAAERPELLEIYQLLDEARSKSS